MASLSKPGLEELPWLGPGRTASSQSSDGTLDKRVMSRCVRWCLIRERGSFNPGGLRTEVKPEKYLGQGLHESGLQNPFPFSVIEADSVQLTFFSWQPEKRRMSGCCYLATAAVGN